jgi:hypothetical protein
MNKDIFTKAIPSEYKPKDKRFDKMELQYLPKLPATFYILGQCGSGKSSILWNLLTEGYVYGKNKKSVFDECLIYLGTLDSKDTFEKKLQIENKLILDDYSAEDFEEYMDDLKEHQMEKLSKNKAPLNTCLIFDDFVSANLMRKPRPNAKIPIEHLLLTSRHEANCSVFVNSQVYKNVGFSKPSVRNNITTFVISKMGRGELLKIAEELSGDYQPEEWLYHYDRCIASKPYNFVTYDHRRPDGCKWMERFHLPFPQAKRTTEILKSLRLKDVSSSEESSSESDSD